MDTIMATAVNKQRVLTQIFTVLKKRYEPSELEARPVLEQFLYAICREGAPREQADRAFRNLQERFFDWNEVRVSSLREVEEALEEIPDAEYRANRLISFLQEVFETTYSFDLEGLGKKGLKQAAKQLGRYQAASDYVVAWVVQKSLGGHAIPVDPPTLAVLRRIGLLDDDESDLETLRASLEHLVPKVRGALFIELISALAHDPDWEDDASCPFHDLVPEDENAEESNGAATALLERVTRTKPR
jgi:endonuclease III